MNRRALMILLAAQLALGACSHDKSVSCEDSARYASSVSVPPVRVPDDLSVPDEADALRIPDERAARERPNDLPCLESPPDFFGGEENAAERPPNQPLRRVNQ